MKKIFMLCCFTALCAVLSACAKKLPDTPGIEDIEHIRENRYSCTFDGVKHSFIIDLPENCKGSPLVLMLHGYGGSAERFRTDVHFEEKANPMGYTVVYAEGAADPTDRTSSKCWNSQELPDSNKDADFLTALAEYLQEEYFLDRNRTFAVGFSNGAFMTHTLAMRKSGTFSALVSVAGLMQESVWETRNSSADVSFFQITGEKDDAVPKKSDGTAEHSQAPAIEDVMAYWAEANGAVLTESRTIGKGSELSVYSNAGTGRQVWHLTVRNGSHSWPVMQYSGFDTNDIILEFLETQKK